ncbi:MAG: DUF3306 domain-containing protein [Noviherbaspirillum sp.]
MEAEDFFKRWARRGKDQDGSGADPAPASGPANDPAPDAPATPPVAEDLPPPTLEDVEHLTGDSDFSRFMGREVDETVKRSAMKKLFANPRFNVMDGLDVYIEDYNKFVPLTPDVLAKLEHAKSLLDPLKHLEKPVMRVIDKALGQDVPDTASAGAVGASGEAGDPGAEKTGAEMTDAAKDDAAKADAAKADAAKADAVASSPEADRNPAGPAKDAAAASGSGADAASVPSNHADAARAADNPSDHSDPSHEHPI